MLQTFKVTKDILEKAEHEVLVHRKFSCCCALTMAIKEKIDGDVITFSGGGQINGVEFRFGPDTEKAANEYMNRFDLHFERFSSPKSLDDMEEFEFQIYIP